MIRRALAALALLCAAPAHADPVMTQGTCDAGWAAFTDALEMPRYLRNAGQIVTPDGWCRVDKTTADLKKHDFNSLNWRASGVAHAIEHNVPPQSLDAVFDGVAFADAFGMQFPQATPPENGSIRYHMHTDAKGNTLVELTLDVKELGNLSLSARAAGVDFSSAANMQMTVGSARFHLASINARLTAPLSQAIQTRFAPLPNDTAQAAALATAIPEAAISTEGRNALAEFLAAWPKADGSLSLNARSDGGFGALQLRGGWAAQDRGGSLTDAMAVWLSGVKLSATWTPDQ